jgi:hypothetical protein
LAQTIEQARSDIKDSLRRTIIRLHEMKVIRALDTSFRFQRVKDLELPVIQKLDDIAG